MDSVTYTTQMTSTPYFYLQTASWGQLLGARKGREGMFQGQEGNGEPQLLESSLKVIS